MIQIISSGGLKYERKMWRYGRIFDDTFMSPLQIRACPSLTYALASALKMESSKPNERILGMVQLADVNYDL